MEDTGNEMLSRVIEVEKEIQEMIDSERKKSEEWMRNVRDEVEAEVLKEDESLKNYYSRAIEEEIIAVKEKAGEILKDAEERAQKILKIDEETLTKFVMKHIPEILPGH